MGYTALFEKILHSSIHNSNWGWGRVYLNNFIKIMFLEQHPNVHFVLEFGQFICHLDKSVKEVRIWSDPPPC